MTQELAGRESPVEKRGETQSLEANSSRVQPRAQGVLRRDADPSRTHTRASERWQGPPSASRSCETRTPRGAPPRESGSPLPALRVPSSGQLSAATRASRRPVRPVPRDPGLPSCPAQPPSLARPPPSGPSWARCPPHTHTFCPRDPCPPLSPRLRRPRGLPENTTALRLQSGSAWEEIRLRLPSPTRR